VRAAAAAAAVVINAAATHAAWWPIAEGEGDGPSVRASVDGCLPIRGGGARRGEDKGRSEKWDILSGSGTHEIN